MFIRRVVSSVSVVLLLFVLTAMSAVTVFAAGEAQKADYYMSYKKFVATENADGSKKISYNEITDQISNLLKEGMRRYTSGSPKDGDDGYYKPFTNAHVR